MPASQEPLQGLLEGTGRIDTGFGVPGQGWAFEFGNFYDTSRSEGYASPDCPW